MMDITYHPDPDTLRAAQGWGQCLVKINQQPFWYGGTAQNSEALEWTWIDLLHHLGRNWLDIITEAPWPNERLVAAMQEGKDFWALAEDDWSEMSPDAADQEEAQLLAFVRPRNLAHALQGLSLPALYCYRQGKDMQLCPEGMVPLRMPANQFIETLEKLGEQIDQGLGQTTHARAQQAQNAWRNRNRNKIPRQISISTGLSATELSQLQQGQSPDQYWELPSSANDEHFNANGLLAAARMIAPLHLGAEQKQQLLAELRQQPANPQALQQLDALAGALRQEPAPNGKPHEQGYQLAQLLRSHYQVSASQQFPITQVIEQLKLPMCSTRFDCPQLKAMAIWGHRGPAILLNADIDANTSASHVRRILLAHELCHLLFDRQHAQPAADVLGANTTSTSTEQRAKAFAAELLLPRDSAANAYAQHPTLRDAITSLSKTFDVSPKVAKTQILNSGTVNTDDEDDIRAQLRQDRFPG